MLKQGYKQKIIGAKFGVDASVISFIKTGKAWSHI
jgi:hypothetical protein